MVKILILVCAGVYFWTVLAGGFAHNNEIYTTFGLVPYVVWSKLAIWGLATYIFLHGNFWHLFFNMFALWMFGAELERVWGRREFLRFFFVTGVGAGVFSVLLDPYSPIPVVGASGAIYGILMAFGLLFPNRIIYLFLVFPIKVKYLVAFVGAMAFFSSLNSPGSTVAHSAHLGGMLVGFFYLKVGLSPSDIRQAYYRWKIRRMRRRFQVHENPNPPKKPRRDDDFWIN